LTGEADYCVCGAFSASAFPERKVRVPGDLTVGTDEDNLDFELRLIVRSH
jgi:hypothetical protein